MSRRRVNAKRVIFPDPKYGSELLAKFVNVVMKSGKKSIAEQIVYGALERIEGKLRRPPVDAFKEALDNVMPSIEVRSRRVGGATYQVPVEVRTSRQQALAMRWLVDYARARGEKSMPQRLAGELIDASQGRGAAVKKREDTHRMAEANKAFSHYRF